jgi:two-component system nitrate/nitrite response regulator NarL
LLCLAPDAVGLFGAIEAISGSVRGSFCGYGFHLPKLERHQLRAAGFPRFVGLSPFFSYPVDSFAVHTGEVAKTLLIVDDDSFARITLTETLTSHGFHVVESCETASEAIRVHRSKLPLAALVDLDLGKGPTGLDVATAMRRDNPAVGIVFLSSYRDPRLIASRGQKPPLGSQYLVKSDLSDVRTLLRAIELSITAKKSTSAWDSPINDLSTLTNTQIETLKLVAEGHSNREIARIRHVTEKSVEQTVGRIASKLGIVNRLETNQRVAIAQAFFRNLGVTIHGRH